ncbi:MAG: hypothetical protein ACP5O4_08435, partial [bacterium]
MKILLTKEEILEDPLYIRGIQEGILKGKVEAILDILSLRFSDIDLSDISEKLKDIQDLERLDYLKNKAKTVS